MTSHGAVESSFPGFCLVPFDRARDSLSRMIFLRVLDWDFDLADIDPPDPEMVQHIEQEPKIFKYEIEPQLAPELV